MRLGEISNGSLHQENGKMLSCTFCSFSYFLKAGKHGEKKALCTCEKLSPLLFGAFAALFLHFTHFLTPFCQVLYFFRAFFYFFLFFYIFCVIYLSENTLLLRLAHQVVSQASALTFLCFFCFSCEKVGKVQKSMKKC